MDNKDDCISVSSSKLKRLQGQEHTKQIKERNKCIIDDFLVGIDNEPKDLTSKLAVKYGISKSQVNRVVKDVRKQHRLEKAQRVVSLRNVGLFLREIAVIESVNNILKQNFESVD